MSDPGTLTNWDAANTTEPGMSKMVGWVGRAAWQSTEALPNVGLSQVSSLSSQHGRSMKMGEGNLE